MALQHFNKPCDEVRLGYRIVGEARAWSYLSCEYEWDMVLHRVREKILAARTRAVTVELRNMVGGNSYCPLKSTYWSSRCEGKP